MTVFSLISCIVIYTFADYHSTAQLGFGSTAQIEKFQELYLTLSTLTGISLHHMPKFCSKQGLLN